MLVNYPGVANRHLEAAERGHPSAEPPMQLEQSGASQRFHVSADSIKGQGGQRGGATHVLPQLIRRATALEFISRGAARRFARVGSVLYERGPTSKTATENPHQEYHRGSSPECPRQSWMGARSAVNCALNSSATHASLSSDTIVHRRSR